ncbi:hypothetical protein [Absicoccus intestinalis]|uniref:Uncharacterized protein n=1 Tax=Absicoccus intestinalis TaxID=2926319 RepID=A0ABU4WKP0_9FIRM|nr:hypothetical protein [Absicoccus sp. CLA-KB-P134]MDX8417123.1 hypothetical protein [Absicoccus sp. CLA-KB-P134]
MSESIKLIYKNLKILEKSMDYPEFDVDRLSPEALGTSLNRRIAILETLLKKDISVFRTDENVSVARFIQAIIDLFVDKKEKEIRQ